MVELLETSDVSHILSLSAIRVRELADEGRFPTAARTPRGGRLFRREDVEGYLRSVRDRRCPSGLDGA
jgi:hypothetical protein